MFASDRNETDLLRESKYAIVGLQHCELHVTQKIVCQFLLAWRSFKIGEPDGLVVKGQCAVCKGVAEGHDAAQQFLAFGLVLSFTEASSLAREARRNKAKVLNGGLTIEHQLAEILSYYFFGRTHERKAIFEALVLNSDWCSFAAKRRLIAQIIEDWFR
jgi:hypothetical protein